MMSCRSITSRSTLPLPRSGSLKSIQTSTKRRSSKEDTLPELESDEDKKFRKIMDDCKMHKINPIDKRRQECWKPIQLDQMFRDQARYESSRPSRTNTMIKLLKEESIAIEAMIGTWTELMTSCLNSDLTGF